ncbi:hypothetical protein HD554DRAFT_320937 [Boletus coccyginus]|nr:hypothetical protein HD554DRAFT_320937 [Boletus coccyginus]
MAGNAGKFLSPANACLLVSTTMSSDPLSYFSIQELRLTFKDSDSKRISKSLKLVAGSSERTVTGKRKDGLTHSWFPEPVINVPSGEDLTVKPRYSKLRHPFSPLNELVVTGKELLDGCINNSGRITKQGSDYMLEIVATVHGISDVKLDDIPSVSDLPLSLEDIQKGIEGLKSVLSCLGKCTDVLGGIMAALDILGDAHPIARAVVIALSIPYKLLENEREFHNDLKSLGDVMRNLIMCLTEVQDVAKISPVKKNFEDILGAVLRGSSFIQDYLKKDRPRQIVAAQFRSELDGLKLEFSELRNTFKDAIASQTLINTDAMVNANRLKEALKPVPLAEPGERCMPGTRVDQLATIRDWIADTQKLNIFLIYGSPGAGKSAISSTIPFEIPPKHHCTQIFFQRDEADRRDPTRVWPTVAFELAKGDRNMKKGIVDILDNNKIRLHGANVTEQFEALIREPLVNAGERQPVAPFVFTDVEEVVRTSAFVQADRH